MQFHCKRSNRWSSKKSRFSVEYPVRTGYFLRVLNARREFRAFYVGDTHQFALFIGFKHSLMFCSASRLFLFGFPFLFLSFWTSFGFPLPLIWRFPLCCGARRSPPPIYFFWLVWWVGGGVRAYRFWSELSIFPGSGLIHLRRQQIPLFLRARLQIRGIDIAKQGQGIFLRTNPGVRARASQPANYCIREI